tara:strand:- start:8862 stop:9578 length:717 start_codon:yes stop_codon:yes gene_type:complete
MEFSSLVRFAVFICFALTIFGLERWRPRIVSGLDKRRLGTNIGLGLASYLVMRVLAPISLIHVASLTVDRNFGLMNWLPVGLAAMPIGLILFDLLLYWQHYFFHKYSFLWELHKLHHQDQHLDLTSGVRFHPLEIIISYGIKLIFILALGIGPWTILICEIWLSSMSLFSHSNFNLGEKLESNLQRFIITPDYHRIHHSVTSEQMHSNFCNGFSFWDKKFSTYSNSSREQADKIVVGL